MSKQSAIILILAVFLGTIGALIWFYFTSNTPQTTSLNFSTTTNAYNPFGTLPNNTSSTTNITTTNSTTTSVAMDKLRQISSDPVSGFSVIDDAKNQQKDSI